MLRSAVWKDHVYSDRMRGVLFNNCMRERLTSDCPTRSSNKNNVEDTIQKALARTGNQLDPICLPAYKNNTCATMYSRFGAAAFSTLFLLPTHCRRVSLFQISILNLSFLSPPLCLTPLIPSPITLSFKLIPFLLLNSLHSHYSERA